MKRDGALIFFACGLLAAIANASSYELQLKLTAPDGAVEDLFGHSVALAGDRALVGSYRDDDNGPESGSAYLFDTTTGALVHKLRVQDGEEYEFHEFDWFGYSVAITGETALIGAYFNDENGVDSGAAYLFDTTTGALLHKLIAPDGAPDDRFGISVALSGGTALVGSYLDGDNGFNSGSAYLFDTATGSLLQKLTAPDGAVGDQFGISVALSGDRALIGSRQDNDNGLNSGSAYLFDTTTGAMLHKFTAPDGAALDNFGFSVALSDDKVLIGNRWDDDNELNSGSAYLFDMSTGGLLHKFTAPDGAANDWFGYSVALAGDRALVGSYLHGDDDSGSNSGSAYLYDTVTGALLQKLTAPDGAAGDQFGVSVALADDRALIGSWYDDDNGAYSGSAYLFRVPEPGSAGLCLLGVMGWRARRH